MLNIILLTVSIIFCYTGAQASDTAQNDDCNGMKPAVSFLPAATTFVDVVDDVLIYQILPKFYGRDLFTLARTCRRFDGFTKDSPILREYKYQRYLTLNGQWWR